MTQRKKRHQVSPLKTQAQKDCAHQVWTHTWNDSLGLGVQSCRCGYWRLSKRTGAVGKWRKQGAMP